MKKRRVKQKERKSEDRTEAEVYAVVNAPLSIELEVAVKAIVDDINKLPLEARPPAKQAAIMLIEGIQKSVDALINQLPGDFKYLNVAKIKSEALKLELEIQKDPTLSTLKKVAELIEEVDDSVDTLTSPPSYPHYLSTELVDDQADQMKQYIRENVIG